MKDSFLKSSAAFVGPVGSEGGRDHVVEPRVLERDEHGHHLGQARDRHAARRALRQEHVAGPAVLHDVCARIHVGSRSEGRGDERERGRYGEQPKLQRAKGYRRLRAHCERRARPPSRAGGRRSEGRTASPPRASRGSSPAGGRPDLALEARRLLRGRRAPVVLGRPERVEHRARRGDERARRAAREGAGDVGRPRSLRSDPR